MRTISRFPIYTGASILVDVPVGAQPLSVSLNVHTYYLHALHDVPPVKFEKRRIAAFIDEAPLPDGPLGDYLGSLPQSGDQRRWHFFDQGVAVGAFTAADHTRIINESLGRVPATVRTNPCGPCSQEQWKAGKSAAKTCERCGLGPCTNNAAGGAA